MPYIPSVSISSVSLTSAVAPGGLLFDIRALLTNKAREYISISLVDGMFWGNYEFEVGGGGFNLADPTIALPVDPDATTLLDPVFGREPVDDIERPSDDSTAYYCVLETGEANYELGEIAVYAEVLYAPTNPGLVGTTFMFAHAHHPARFKTSDNRMSYRVCVQS